MRLWSEEHRLGTIELLLTMPVSPWQAILGQVLRRLHVWLIGLTLTFPIVLTVFYLGKP
jgi:ABC-2 type transport system permease protein